jgi:hypothetical protein
MTRLIQKLFLNKDEKLTSYGPAMYPITVEQSQSLISGGSITIEHVDYKVDKGGQRISDKSSRLYAGPRRR